LSILFETRASKSLMKA